MPYMGVTDQDIKRLIDAVKKAGGRQSSGLRSSDHNKRVGGVPNSYHLSGKAADFVGLPFSMVQSILPSGYKAIDEGNHIHVEPISSRSGTRPSIRSVSRGGAREERSASMAINPLYKDYPDIFSGAKAAFGIGDDEKRKAAVAGLLKLAADRGMSGGLQESLFGGVYNPAASVMAAEAPANPLPFNFGIRAANPDAKIPTDYDFRGQGVPDALATADSAPTQPSFQPSLQPNLIEQMAERINMLNEIGVLPQAPEKAASVPSFEEWATLRGVDMTHPMSSEDLVKKQKRTKLYGGIASLLAHILSPTDKYGFKNNDLAAALARATEKAGNDLQNKNDALRQNLFNAYNTYQQHSDDKNKLNYNIQQEHAKQRRQVLLSALSQAIKERERAEDKAFDVYKFDKTLEDKVKGRDIQERAEERRMFEAVNLNNYRNARNEIDLQKLDADIEYKGNLFGLRKEEIALRKLQVREQLKQSGERIAETSRHNRAMERTNQARENRLTSTPTQAKKTEAEIKRDLRKGYRQAYLRIMNSKLDDKKKNRQVRELRSSYINDFGTDKNFSTVVHGQSTNETE